MRIRKDKLGFSMIEVILSIVIIACSFISLAMVIGNASLQNIDVELATTGLYLARGKMAEVMVKDFDSTSDIAQTNFTGNFADYSYTVVVDYVDGTNPDNISVAATDYKKVHVLVQHADSPGSISLTDLKVRGE